VGQVRVWVARLGGLANRERLLAVLLVAAAGAGHVAGLAAYCAGRCLSALVAGASMFWAAVRAKAGPWLRRSLAACMPAARSPEDSRT